MNQNRVRAKNTPREHLMTRIDQQASGEVEYRRRMVQNPSYQIALKLDNFSTTLNLAPVRGLFAMYQGRR